MIKKVFKKQCQLNVSVDTVKINEDFYVFKYEYTVDLIRKTFFGLCYKEDLKDLTENFLIPDRLSEYNIYYSDVLEFERTQVKEIDYHNMDIYNSYKINFEDFFLEDKSLIPPLDKCIVLKEKEVEIPNLFSVNKPIFLFKYGEDFPLAQMVNIDAWDGMREYNPLISDLDYDLEKTIEYLENREDIKVNEKNVWEEDEIVGKTKIFSLTEIVDLNNRKIVFNNTIIDKAKVSYIGVEKDKYIEFCWFPNSKDWKTYYHYLSNYGLDVANKYLVDEILKIQRK